MKEIVISEKIELRDYANIKEIGENKYTITFEFKKPVIMNFDCPNLFWYDFINSTEKIVTNFFIKAKTITFNGPFFAAKKIYAENITTNSALRCDKIVASNNIEGHDIRANLIKAKNINLKYLSCKKINCSNDFNAEMLILNNIEFKNICAKHLKTIK